MENNFINVNTSRFIEDIINGMNDWVRVIDAEDNIIYINRSMAEGLQGEPIGKKCFEVIGRTAPCENCIARKAIFDGHVHHKEEIINGRIFSVMSSPVRNDRGEITAVVEVLRDVTQIKEFQQKIMEQNLKLQYDLSIARKLQCSLLPKGLPEDKLKFSFIYKPCEELGGDFLDIFRIDDTHVGIYIADVSGHGVPASMMTVFLRSTINKKVLSPSKALGELYREFNRSTFDQDLYITVFYAIIDVQNKTITFSNAGHNVCPVILGQEGFKLLNSPGIPISNWLESPDYSDSVVSLGTGDRIFLCTDGIIEMRNTANEQFGEDRLLEILLSDKSGPSGTLNKIIDVACEFAGIKSTYDVPDDITMALLEII
ncbi:MAG: SpoIIE family protein phosphatase [Clostridia bacterium]|nr:SpoIIE family protein phosphatase [Clostridia bacterium]